MIISQYHTHSHHILVDGKGYPIYYGKNMFETTNQIYRYTFIFQCLWYCEINPSHILYCIPYTTFPMFLHSYFIYHPETKIVDYQSLKYYFHLHHISYTIIMGRFPETKPPNLQLKNLGAPTGAAMSLISSASLAGKIKGKAASGPLVAIVHWQKWWFNGI